MVILTACTSWSLITAAARDGRPEDVLLAVPAVASGYAAGRRRGGHGRPGAVAGRPTVLGGVAADGGTGGAGAALLGAAFLWVLYALSFTAALLGAELLAGLATAARSARLSAPGPLSSGAVGP
jgi:hypothetical protein